MQNNVDSNQCCIRLISIFYLPKCTQSIITQSGSDSTFHISIIYALDQIQFKRKVNISYMIMLIRTFYVILINPYICPASMLMHPRGYWVTDLQQVIVRNTETSLEFMCFVLIHVIWPEGSQSCFRDRLSLDLISSPCKEDKAKKLFALLMYPLRDTHTHSHMLLWLTEEAEQESFPLLSVLSSRGAI